jgi:hypothetical protein
MSPDFPWYSDLGGTPENLPTTKAIVQAKYEPFHVSPTQASLWEHQVARRAKYRTYYDGSVFLSKVPLEFSNDQAETPTLYPVGLNLVKMMAVAQAEALWGEWDQDIVRWQVRQDAEETPATQAAIELCQTIFNVNNFASLGYELGLDREIYGGCAIKVAPALTKSGYISLQRIDLDNFFPIWDPDDPDTLLECWIAVAMTQEQARNRYDFRTDKDVVTRLEHWTKTTYENTLDGVRMDAYSGQNPWGLVPVKFIPRLRTTDWWGDPLAPDIIPIQDEMNMRVADMGEAINYNAHPTRWGTNLPRNFTAANFPLGPQAMWDLGRTVMRDNVPAVGILETKNPVHQTSLDFVKFLYDWSRTASFAPPIAFGEDEGGGQRSGRTLEIRMWPLMRATRRSRAYMGNGLLGVMQIAATIIRQKDIENMQHSTARILEGSIIPSFWPLLPKDDQAIVDRIVKLFNLPVPIPSLKTVLKMLGLGPSEEQRIRDMLNDPDFAERFKKAGAAPAGPQGSDEETDNEPDDEPKEEITETTTTTTS